MTRETKIGLLVGLAFIIIVGILLSEPLNHAGDSQPAPLPGVGQNVRVAVTSPGAGNTPPPISMQTGPAAPPQQQVPTQQEVNRPRGGIQIVVGGSDTPPAQPRTTQLSNTGTTEAPPAHGGTVVVQNDPPQAHNNAPNSDPIFNAANEHGETLVPVGTRNNVQPGNGKPLAKGNRQYEVVPGDSLSKIAQKFYGSSAKPYRDAIVAANPSLKADPNRLMAGVAYTIPAVESAPTNAPVQTPTTLVQKPSQKPVESANVYTVKPGDNLWAIARDQCGDTAAIPALKELNKDSLKGGEAIRVGMKLKLPNKPVATIN